MFRCAVNKHAEIYQYLLIFVFPHWYAPCCQTVPRQKLESWQKHVLLKRYRLPRGHSSAVNVRRVRHRRSWGTDGRARCLSRFAQGKACADAGRASTRSARVPQLEQAWCSKLRKETIRRQIVRIRISLAVPSKRRRPKDRRPATAVDVEPMQ